MTSMDGDRHYRCRADTSVDGWRYVCVGFDGHEGEHTWKLALVQRYVMPHGGES